MPKKVSLVPYNYYSRAAKSLVDENITNQEFSFKRFDQEDILAAQSFSQRDRLIVNWGCSKFENWTTDDFDYFASRNVFMLNPKIKRFTNKKLFFLNYQPIYNDNMPSYAITQEGAENLLDFGPVVCRTKLEGHSGDGIVIANSRDELVPAPLYTQYIKKTEEYRVHFFKGFDKLIVQQKRLRLNASERNFQVRNAANGWVFCREQVSCPESVLDLVRIFRDDHLNPLDFGAIDIIYNQRQARPYILEVNTAPGLMGQTIVDYSAFLKASYDVHINGQDHEHAAVTYGFI